jgi:hypothetical protein
MTLDSSSSAIEASVVDPQAKYSIDIKGFEAAGRSFTYSVYSRMSPRGMAQLGGSADEIPSSLGTPSEMMKIVASICSKEPDYLLPGTPISEAVFRLLLANGNRPMKLMDIQTGLATAWSSVIYLKNLSDEVVQRMLDAGNEYFIRRVE